jgi:hypothetical protein
MADEAKPSDGAPAEPQLPMVESPKLDGSDEIAPHIVEAASEQAEEASGEAAASESPARSSRFALLAAAVALAAALGSFVGSLSASGLAHLWPATASSRIADANALQALKAELAELSALNANLDGATRSANGQFAKIADRLDRVERAQVDPAAKIAHITDTVDRLDKRSAALPETTGSIASSQPPATEPKTVDPVLAGWIVQDVQDGRALVASHYGGVFDVAAGSVLPGVGRVETIKRQDGQWVVVTAHGMITSGR